MSADPNNGNTSPTGKPPRRRPAQPGIGGVNLLIVFIFIGLIALMLSSFFTAGTVEWGEFYRIVQSPEDSKNLKAVLLRAGDVIEVEVYDPSKLPEAVRNKIGKGARFSVVRPHTSEDTGVLKRFQTLAVDHVDADGKPKFRLAQEPDTGMSLMYLIGLLLPALLILGLMLFLMPRFRDPLGGGFLNNYIKSPAKRYERNKSRTTFDDVAGMQNAKSELQEIVEFLRSPEKFQRLGAMIPKGVLLIGQPGTGKTLLARAVAGEAGVPFFSISGSEFIQMFVGVGASVTGDTPILVRANGTTRLMPIGEFVDGYYRESAEGYVVPVTGVETLGFEEKDSKFKGSSKVFVSGSRWSNVKGVYRHRVTEIYEIHYLGGMVRTTGDHSVFIRTRDGIKAIPARDIKPGDVLVNLPMKVRGQFSQETGTPHEVRGHTFAPLAEPLYLTIHERDEDLAAAYTYAIAHQDDTTQREIAEVIGVSQMTVSNWQTGRNLPRGLSDRYPRTPIPERVEVTPDLLRLLGYYTAEGRNNGCVQFVFGSHEPDLHADCIALGERLFGVTPLVTPTTDNSTRITFYSAPLGRFFERLCGNGSKQKHIPEILWGLPREYFLAYLEGYTRGDGYTSTEGKLCATSVSHQLIRELAWLCAMHGIKAGIREGFTPGGRIITATPLPDEHYWTLIIGKTSNPFLPAGAVESENQGKKPIVREVIVKPFDGYVYDLCGCDNEAFFGGEKPVLLHNSRVRDLFKTAKENAPALIFIDEIDAVGRMRGAGVGGGSDEREQTLNQILSEMDGFQPNEAVIIIAATNRPDVLDSALLRPGRFDRHITVDRPTWQGRLAILKVHTRNKPLADDVNLELLARNLTGMTGADLRNLANEAALLATREGKSRIEQRDFERAFDRVLLGPRREEILNLEGKRRTACHEIGHALVGLLEPALDPPSRVTIVPRGQALGVTLMPPDEDRLHRGTDYWKAQLAFTLGGRAADRIMYGQAYSGHESDLKQATRLARYMVTHWGMSERLGPMAFRQGEEHLFLGKELQQPRDYSEDTARLIDEEVEKLLREADERAEHLLAQHREMLERLVDALVQREEMTLAEIEEIAGVRRPAPGVNSTSGTATGIIPAN